MSATATSISIAASPTRELPGPSRAGAPASDDSPRPPCPLEEALAYTHAGVVARFTKDYGGSPEVARQTFDDVKRWLWLCARWRYEIQHAPSPRTPPRLSLYPCQTQLDQMWHTFILFTRDYDAYCRDRFGAYIHHIPNVPTLDPAPVLDEAQQFENLRCMVRYTYTSLGVEVARRWYQDLGAAS